MNGGPENYDRLCRKNAKAMIKKLGLAPVHCVVMEDLPIDVASMESIGIGFPSPVGSANMVLPNLMFI